MYENKTISRTSTNKQAIIFEREIKALKKETLKRTLKKT